MLVDVSKLNLELARSCLSIKDLSEKANVSRYTITRINSDKNLPVAPSTIGKIAKALCVPVESLIKDYEVE